jgi:hypothetical protein
MICQGAVRLWMVLKGNDCRNRISCRYGASRKNTVVHSYFREPSGKSLDSNRPGTPWRKERRTAVFWDSNHSRSRERTE